MAIRFLCVLALTVVTVQSSQGWTFTSQDYGYTLDVPAGWEIIPKSIVKEHAAARFPNEAIVVDAGFQPAPNNSTVGYPRIVTVVLPNAKMGINRQLTDKEIWTVASQLSGYSVQELQELGEEKIAEAYRDDFSVQDTWKPYFDEMDRRLAWKLEINTLGVPVVGYNTLLFGNRATVILGHWVRQGSVPTTTEDATLISRSLKFNPAHAYKQPLVASPNTESLGTKLLQTIVTAALSVLMIGGIAFLITKFKEKFFSTADSGQPTQTTSSPLQKDLQVVKSQENNSVIRIFCQQCNSQFTAPETAAGKQTKCPKCGTLIVIQKPWTYPRMVGALRRV